MDHTTRRALAGALAGMLAAAMPASGAEAAPANPYRGMQKREEVYEFTQKPVVEKKGDKWVIRFASKGQCDATIAMVDKDGKIIRHLASGVLGKNAPHPFQQNTLSQKIEWDGTDDMGKKAPAGCSARVSLGLKASFERFLYQAKPGLASRGPIAAACDHQGTLYVMEAACGWGAWSFGSSSRLSIAKGIT